uniref:Uncharacterized protein n=1 Tax=Craspedostauros australis TaxID=1486917 RepID=A0A7R9WNA1_9STRA
MMKENKSLKATEKKFRTQLRRKYKQQLWRQELHLRSEETQNALYKKCLGRIVHHVTRHEAIANRKPRRASDQPIVFELSDLVSAQPNRTTPIAPRDDDSRRMSDRSSSSSIYEYDSCTDESDDE